MGWIEQNRKVAADRFKAVPMPTMNEENYRFTSLGLDSLEAENNKSSQKSSIKKEDSSVALLKVWGSESEYIGAKGNFTLLSMTEALEKKDLQEAFATNVFSDDKFSLLAESEWNNGFYLNIDSNVEKPIQINLHANGSRQLWRNAIFVEKAASAVVVQEFTSELNLKFAIDTTEVFVKENGSLHWIILQSFEAGSVFLPRHKANISKGGSLKITVLQTGGDKTQNRLEVNLNGTDANLDLAGAVKGFRGQHFDVWNEVKHKSPHTKSSMDLYFLMNDQSRSVFNGLIHIEKTCNEVEAYQKSKSLLLSSKATVHAIPKLIIQTDSVKCAHGASVSTVNPEQVHYLQSRGIAKNEAEKMIIKGFVEPIYARMPNDDLHRKVCPDFNSEDLLQ